MNYHNRRQFLISSSAAFLSILVPGVVYGQVVRKIVGKVWVNNRIMQSNDLIYSEDEIRTGPNSEILFVVAGDAHWVKENSTLKVRAREGALAWLHLITGTLTSSFSSGKKEILTPVATIGIRGTSVCLHVNEEETYFCTCYGETTIRTKEDPEGKRVKASHHIAHVIQHHPSHNITVAIFPKLLHHSDKEILILDHELGRSSPSGFSY